MAILKGLPSFQEAPKEVVTSPNDFWERFIAFVSTQASKNSPRTLPTIWRATKQGSAASAELQEFVRLVVKWIAAGQRPMTVLPILESYYTVDANQRALAASIQQACDKGP